MRVCTVPHGFMDAVNACPGSLFNGAVGTADPAGRMVYKTTEAENGDILLGRNIFLISFPGAPNKK